MPVADDPREHARDYLARTVRAYQDPRRGGLAARYIPAIIPGLPLAPVVAFIAPANHGDDNSRTTSLSFHEIGYYQVPAGPRDGPTPSPDPAAPNSAWAYLALTEPWRSRIREALGRDARIDAGWADQNEDQTAVGLSMLRKDYERATARLDPAVRPSSWRTAWGLGVMFGSFGDGASTFASMVNPYAAALAQVPEAGRFEAWVHLVAADALAGNPFRQRAHRALRVWQKLALADALATAVGLPKVGVDFGSDANVGAHVAVLRAADGSGESVAGLSLQPPPVKAAGMAGTLLGLVVLVGGAVAFWKATGH